jgi:Outer membrane protein beta-barrel domain
MSHAKNALKPVVALCGAVLLAGLPGLSQARDVGGYFGGMLSRISVDDTGGASPHPTAGALQLGYDLGPHLALEARLGTGLSSDSVSVEGIDVDFKIKSFVGGYLRGTLPLSDSFGVYGLLGYASGKAEASAMGVVASDSEDGVSYFVGAEFNFGADREHGLALEWGQVVEDAKALSLAYRYRF